MISAPNRRMSHRSQAVQFCAILFSLSTITGCAPLQVSEHPVILRGLSPEEAVSDRARVEALAAANEEAEQYYRKVEWPLHVDANKAPELAIALSGGGLRSGVFSLGVLSGLHELKVFPRRTDLLSAASGGAYIASWFYAQQILNGCSPEDLLEPNGVGQQYLQEHADFVHLKRPESWGVITSTLIPMGLVNLFANGVFGWHANTPVSSRYYKHRFQQTFFSGDCRSTSASPKGGENASQDKLRKAPSVSWQQIREKISEANKSPDPDSHLPNLILNTTADIGYFYGEKARRGFNSVYEFTPQRFGSEGMGFYCYADPADPVASKKLANCKVWPSEMGPLERIAVTSGAAYDTSRVHYRSLRLLFSALNFDLGHFFPNPGATPGRDWQLVLPFPIYPFTSQHRLDNQGRRVLLSDGGHSDNLGVYALVRRAPARIVVVDGESDAKHKFGAYHKLKEKLIDDLGLVLSIPGIERSEPGPIYYGTLGVLPQADASVATIDITYIKIPTRKFIRGRCEERKRLEKVGSIPPESIPGPICAFLDDDKKFPFNGTFTDLYYLPDQFAAYRDLGMWIVTSSRNDLEKRLLLSD